MSENNSAPESKANEYVSQAGWWLAQNGSDMMRNALSIVIGVLLLGTCGG